MVSGSIAKLSLDVVPPAVALARGRRGTRVSASRLNGDHGREADHSHGRRTIDRRAVAQLAEGVPSPTIDRTTGGSPAGMHGARGDGQENGFAVHGRRLGPVAGARRELTVVVASPT